MESKSINRISSKPSLKKSFSNSSDHSTSPNIPTLVPDDNYFEAKRTKQQELMNLKPPKPESAPNKFLAKLFESPKTHEILSYSIKERVINFMKILGKRRINMIMLRSLAFRGVPNEVPGLRAIIWRVLLGYLPRETAKWE